MLNGGSGTDTLNAALTTTGSLRPALTDIESLVLSSSSAGTATLDLSAATGYTSIENTSSTGGLTLSNVSSAALTFGVNSSSGTTTLKFTDAALAGSADNVAITVNGNTGGITLDDAGGSNKAETVTLASTGAASTLAALTTTNVGTTKLVINGAADMAITAALNAAVVTIDAASATGAVSVTTGAATSAMVVNSGSGADTLTIAGTQVDSVSAGAGNDTIVFDDDDLTTDTIAGGDGTDKLKVTDTGGFTVEDTVFTNATSIETVEVGSAQTTTVSLGTKAAAAGVVTVNDYDGASALTLSITTAYDGKSVTVNLDNNADNNVLAVASAGTVAVTVNADAAQLTAGDDLAFGAGTSDTLNLTAGGNGTLDGGTVGLEIINATATDANVSLTLSADASYISTAATSLTVNASGMGGSYGMAFDASVVNDSIVFTGSAGNDTVYGGQGNDSLSSAAGNDTFTYAAADLTSADTISGGDGTDTLGLSDAGTMVDADFTKVTSVETVASGATVALTIAASTLAYAAGVRNATTGTGNDNISFGTVYGASDTVNVTLSSGNDTVSVSGAATLKVTVDADNIDGSDGGLTGGTGSADELIIDSDGTTDQLIGAGSALITGFEKLTVKDNDGSANLTLSEATIASGVTFTVDASALTSSANALTLVASGDSNGAISVKGGAGIDLVTLTSAGADYVEGGAGNDVVTVASAGFTSADTISGGTGTADAITLSNAATVIDADFTKVTSVEKLNLTGGGTDATLSTYAQAAGVTTVVLTTGTNTITLGSGYTSADTVTVSVVGGTDSVIGSGTAAKVKIVGDGDNITAADTFTAGTGSTDELVFNAAVTGLTSAETAAVTAFEMLTFSTNAAAVVTLNDAVVASGVTFTVDATALTGNNLTLDMSNETNGKYSVSSGAGDDTLTGGAGADTITGGSGNDVIDGGSGNDSVVGGLGNDSITIAQAGDVATGDDGTDTLVLNSIGSSSFVVDLTSSSDQVTTFNGSANSGAQTGFENLTATGLNGNLTATAAAGSTILAGNGADTLTGSSGNDTLSGAAGNDSLISGGGVDSLVGGAGNDVYTVSVTTTSLGGDFKLNEAASGGTADKLVITGSSSSAITIDASGTTNALLSDGDFTAGNTLEIFDLTGFSTSGVTLTTGTGDTTGVIVYGTEQVDSITGGTGADTIQGGSGADVIVGGDGSDSLTGGVGIDTFRTGSSAANTVGTADTDSDTISDFTVGTGGDILDFDSFLGTIAAAGVAVAATAAQNTANDTIYYVNYSSTAIAAKNYGGGDFAELFAAAATGMSVTTASSAKAVVVVRGSDQTQVYFVEDGGNTTIVASEVALVGVLSNATGAMTYDNFTGLTSIA